MRNKEYDEFEQLYRDLYPRLLSFCMRRTRSPYKSCEGIVQEAFLKLWEYQQRQTPVFNKNAFLYAVVRNKIIDVYRRKHLRERIISLDLLKDEYGEAAEPSDPATDVDAYALRQDLEQSIREFPAENQKILRLYYFEGQPVSEIARRTRMRKGTISARLYRARRKIQRSIGAENDSQILQQQRLRHGRRK